MQWHLNEVSVPVESGFGFQYVVFSFYSICNTKNISGNFQGAQYTSFLVVKIADSVLCYCE